MLLLRPLGALVHSDSLTLERKSVYKLRPMARSKSKHVRMKMRRKIKHKQRSKRRKAAIKAQVRPAKAAAVPKPSKK